ncbi:MAG: phosphoribosylformylglycinamidine synthase [Methanohalophilus sp.]|nr:MAG: phosphoribosylformylglycinamidine synthase [Methanohalophilus sp.]
MLPEDDLKIIVEKMGRQPNNVEQGCFLNLWSEHCSYRSSAPLLKSFTTTGDRVIIGPGDDAAIVRFGDGWVLALGMESHNHPSYVDPYNGSATGVGGIVRDIISMGARPIALMDPLYFGPLNTPKNLYLFEHIIEGIGGYGNCIGVPVVRGEAFFDERYSGNPLVNVVCVGLARQDQLVTATAQKAGNKIVLIGSTTGRDGLGGASFASRDLSESAEAEDRPSIQIGDPFTEKLLIELSLEAVAEGVVKSCRDLGAAGLAGASSEMASKGDLGIHIIADSVPQRETGMNAFEIMIAESQERILFEVEPENVGYMLQLAEKYDLNGAVIGELTERPYFTVEFEGNTETDIPIHLLTEGAPTFERPSTPFTVKKDPVPDATGDLKQAILDVLASHNMASKDWIYRQYDHEVQIRTVAKPGSDSAIQRIVGDRGIALSCGCNPRHTYLDPYEGGKGTLAENAMNLAVKGGRGLALLDCLNFGNPEKPDIYWQFKYAINGLADAAHNLSIPVVGGNVSLYNESEEHHTSILPTPAIGLVGEVENISAVPSSEFTGIGQSVILVGTTKAELGGSQYYNLRGSPNAGNVPQVPADMAAIVESLITTIRAGKVAASHDVSQGGLAAALCEMCGNVGVEVNLSEIAGDMSAEELLFSESHGRALLATDDPDAVSAQLGNIPHVVIGTTGGNSVRITVNNDYIEVDLDEIRDSRASLTRLMMK